MLASAGSNLLLRASGLVVMAGAAGFLGLDQFLYGQDESSPVKASNDDRQRPTLVTIFLRGGADSLHAIVPAGAERVFVVDSAWYTVGPVLVPLTVNVKVVLWVAEGAVPVIVIG